MVKTILKAGLLGGGIAYLWGVFSWMVLPWHTVTLEKFSDEQSVIQMLQENASVSGNYILPNPHNLEPGLTREKKAYFMEEGIKKMKQGPFVFAAVSLEGADPASPLPYISNLVLQIVTMLVISWLLLQTRGLSYWQRVVFVVLIGLVAGAQGHLPNWMWWRFSMEYVLVNLADIVFSSFFAGLVIAHFTGR